MAVWWCGGQKDSLWKRWVGEGKPGEVRGFGEVLISGKWNERI